MFVFVLLISHYFCRRFQIYLSSFTTLINSTVIGGSHLLLLVKSLYGRKSEKMLVAYLSV